MSYSHFTWPVFLSRARILPLHEPTTRRSPTTVGVENTQPPVSNSQRISDRLAACRLGAEGAVGGSSKAVTNGSAAPINKNPLHKRLPFMSSILWILTSVRYS